MARTIVLIIDGFGVGSDATLIGENENHKCNTAYSILSQCHLSHPIWEKIGVNKLAIGQKTITSTFGGLHVSAQRVETVYPGADSLVGHMEIFGSYISEQPVYIEDTWRELLRALRPHQKHCYYEPPIVTVGDDIYISNNMEAEAGIAINVLSVAKNINFDQIIDIGNIISKSAKALRVLAIQGQPANDVDIGNSISSSVNPHTGNLYAGIVVPKLEIYNPYYRVENIIDPTIETGVIGRLLDRRLPVTLIGKSADFFNNNGITKYSESNDYCCMKLLKEQMKNQSAGLIVSTLQGIDLAGHAQDSVAAGVFLSRVGSHIEELAKNLHQKDLLIVTADHGNDPLSGGSQHTKEAVPLVALTKSSSSRKQKYLTKLSSTADLILWNHSLKNNP